MSKQTQITNALRLRKIATHIKWSKDQLPVVQSLGNYAQSSLVFVPEPEQPAEDEFDTSWLVTKGVLVPFYCPAPVVIPPGYVMLHLSREKKTGLLTCTAPDMDQNNRRHMRYATLSPDLELTLPGNGKATLTMGAAGYSFKETDPDGPLPGPGSTTEEPHDGKE